MAVKEIILVKPRGFCAGVERAIEILERAIRVFPLPVYVFHEIVHNSHVIGDFKARGVVFANSIDDVPENGVCVFSAHGVSNEVGHKAMRKGIKVIDAACPLVTKVHLEARSFWRKGYSIVLIGHLGHEEVEGTMGHAPMQLVISKEDVGCLEVPNSKKVAYISQTTLSVDDTAEIVEALRRRFSNLEGPPKDDICYATQNRQNAVKELAKRVGVIFVIGSKNSSNSKRLGEIALSLGTPAYVIDDESKMLPEMLEGVKSVGITAGASAPEVLVERVKAYLCDLGANYIEELNVAKEDVTFKIPEDL